MENKDQQESYESPKVGNANGQTIQSITPVASSQFVDTPEQRPSRWRYLFIVLGILQAAGVALFFLIFAWAAHESRSGVSGMEFIVLLMFYTLVPAIGVIALINLIGLPIFMIKRRSHGKMLVLGILSFLISLGLVSFTAYNTYQMYAVPRQLEKEHKEKTEASRKQFAADNAKPEITKEEAIQLLQSCQLKGFYYTNQTDKSDPSNGGWGELSTTGVVLTKVDGKPYRISIADRHIAELVPIAREAQKTCRSPQFWHDGTYEQFKDGKWYFKDQVVNDTQAGKTKEKAVSLMQDCKVDYFVGYTDINAVKDKNTKDWLGAAEKSESGIEILENAPQTHIFASKAKTTELQDTARKFRQSCYSTKKLYVTIDDWIETEYPQGTWTRVKQ